MKCWEKKAYSKKAAQETANHIRAKHGMKLDIYNCPDCNQWHLTKQLNPKATTRATRHGGRTIRYYGMRARSDTTPDTE